MRVSDFLSLVLVFGFLVPCQAQKPAPAQSPAPNASPAVAASPTPTPANPDQTDVKVDEQDVIRIDTKLVQFDAVVTKGSKQVTDLTAADFEIFEDGKPQPITNLSYVSTIPSGPASVATPSPAPGAPKIPSILRPNEVHRTIALVVDDLGMSFQSIDQAKRQLKKFVNEQRAPNDLVAVLRTSAELGARQQFTTDSRVLLSAIESLQWTSCSRVGKNVFSENRETRQDASNGMESRHETDRGNGCGGDSYWQTLKSLRYIAAGLGTLAGRKSMVIFSDSMPEVKKLAGISPYNPPPVPVGSGAQAMPDDPPKGEGGDGLDHFDVATGYQDLLARIVEYAIRGSVVIYAVDTRGVPDTTLSAADSFRLSGPTGAAGREMQNVSSARSTQVFEGRLGASILTSQTGGFLVSNSNDFEIKRVAEDQQGYYLIGYRPVGETFDRKFHDIKVKVKGSGLVVRTRAGFYGVTDKDSRAKLRVAPTNLDAALTSPFDVSEITVRLSSLFTNASDAGSLLRSFIYVNAHDLSFTDGPNGMHNAALQLKSVVFADNGRVMYEREQTASLQLKEQQYAQILRRGLVYDFAVPVKTPGALQFRIAVRDKTSGHLGTAGQVVEVPDLKKSHLTLSGILLAADTNTAGLSGAESGYVAALRRFPPGANLSFAFAVYKSQLDKSTRAPQLTSQTRIFRDGQLVYTGKVVRLDPAGQDRQRIVGGSRIKLGSEFPVGQYVLQVIVIDTLAKESQSTTTQWIDFEIAK
jgi:VWFA-related protein